MVVRISHDVLVSKWGVNVTLDAVTAPEDVIGEGGLQYWAGTEDFIDVTSTDAADAVGGTGCTAIRLEGLNADLKPTFENVPLNGLTIVSSLKKFYRINRAYGLTAGSGGVNAGDIQLHDGTGIMAMILTGRGQTTKATFTVPSGFGKLVVSAVRASLADSKTAHTASGALYTRSRGSGMWRQRQIFSFKDDSPAYLTEATEGFLVKAGDDIRMEIDNADANGLAIQAGFTIHKH